jgi:ubiquitin-conjugating enzyme E2 Z
MSWDPLAILESTSSAPIKQSYFNRRIKEIQSITTEPIEDVFVVQDENKTALVHCVIIGPKGTPYEGGFFYFILVYPNDYPINPFKAKFMTTGGGKVRFNPNLYNCGKLCLSILGTWSGPEWSSIYTIRSTLLSIQTIFNEKPLCNEPGFEGADKARIEDYNNVIIHETMRVAVIGAVQEALYILQMPSVPTGISMPTEIQQRILQVFMERFATYMGICEKYKEKDGRSFESSFGANKGIYKFDIMMRELQELQTQVQNFLCKK